MYRKTFTIPLVSLILILFSFFIAQAQTYGPCNDVYVNVFTTVTGSNSDTKSKTFTLTTGRTVTIQYVIDFAPVTKGQARVCLYNSSGAATPFGCRNSSASVNWTTGSYFLAAGTYTLEVYVNCVDASGTGTQIGSSIDIIANKVAPAIFSVTGGGAACSGGSTSIPIGLNGSEAGLTYQLLRDGTAVGTYTSASGGSFTFGSYNTPGTYTVATIAPCAAAAMNGSAVITDPRPSSFTAWNDGPKCATDPAPIVNLGATNIPGATYYWSGPYNAHQTTSVNTTSVNGLAGTFDYTVYASISGCTTSTATTSVTLYPTPPQTFAGANQNLCALTTALDASPAGTGFTGHWDQVSGPGSTQFQNAGAYNTTVTVTTPGTYVYRWTVSGASVCTASTAQVSVTFNITPSVYAVTPGSASLRCSNSVPITISLAGSQTGVNYQLRINGTNTGTPVAGTGSALTWSDTGSGTYSIQAIGTGGCTQMMTGAPVLTVNPAPTLYTVGGGGAVCSGSPFAITLSGSDTGVNYVLTRGTTTIGALAGTGSSLSWGNQVLPGTFTVTATNPTSGCTRSMGSATVTLNALPSLYSVSGGGDRCDDQPGLTVSLNGSQASVITYQLKLNNVNVGTPVTGTGSALSWSGLTDAGSYTIQGIHSSGCTRTMTNTVIINTKAAPTTANAGPDVNACGEEITLSANAPTVGTGTWVQVSGPVPSQINDPLSPNTIVNVSQPDTMYTHGLLQTATDVHPQTMFG